MPENHSIALLGVRGGRIPKNLRNLLSEWSGRQIGRNRVWIFSEDLACIPEDKKHLFKAYIYPNLRQQNNDDYIIENPPVSFVVKVMDINISIDTLHVICDKISQITHGKENVFPVNESVYSSMLLAIAVLYGGELVMRSVEYMILPDLVHHVISTHIMNDCILSKWLIPFDNNNGYLDVQALLMAPAEIKSSVHPHTFLSKRNVVPKELSKRYVPMHTSGPKDELVKTDSWKRFELNVKMAFDDWITSKVHLKSYERSDIPQAQGKGFGYYYDFPYDGKNLKDKSDVDLWLAPCLKNLLDRQPELLNILRRRATGEITKEQIATALENKDQ